MENTLDSSKDDVFEAISQWPVTNYNAKEHGVRNSETEPIPHPSLKSSVLRCLGKGKNVSKLCEAVEFTVKDNIADEDLADVALAKWWRRTGKHLYGNECSLPQSENPNTILNYVVGTDEGLEFVHSEIRRLRVRVAGGVQHASVSSALSSFYEKLGNFSLAKLHLEAAVDMDPNNKEYKWRLLRLQQSLKFRQEQEDALSKIDYNSVSIGQLFMPDVKQVRRIAANDLTFKDFFYNYALTSTPVVITGVVATMTSQPWTFQHVSDVAGNYLATLKKVVKTSVQWARLEDSKTVKVKDFITSLNDNKAKNEKLYLFDWPIPVNCPELAKEITIPKYFAGDFLQRTSAGTCYRDSWPSLFIAPAAVTSELHVDTFGSNFWMALFEGKKRWMLFDRSDTAMLYPMFSNPWSTDPVFQIDIECPDLKQYPLLSMTQPLECILNPGELLFVPAGCAHRVENLETSLAISGNFVDLSNLDFVRHELSMSSLIDDRSCDLLKQLNDPGFKSNMCGNIEDLKWQEFKTFPHASYESFDITPESLRNVHKERSKSN